MSIDNQKDGKGKFMPPRTASRPNQAINATLDLVKGRTTHTVPINIGAGIIEMIASKATKEKFIAKATNELKLSIVGYVTGKTIKTAIEELTLAQLFVLTQKVNELVAATNFFWAIKRDDEGEPIFWKLRRDYPETVNRKTKSKGKYQRRNRRWSISLLVNMPVLERFYQKLERLIGEATGNPIVLDVPIPHITLFVKGKSLDGIGLGSQAEFDLYKVKRF
jgi:hypothetical protein